MFHLIINIMTLFFYDYFEEKNDLIILKKVK